MGGGVHDDDDEAVAGDGLDRVGRRGRVGCDGRGADVGEWRVWVRRRCRVAVVVALVAARIVDDGRGYGARDDGCYRHGEAGVGRPCRPCR